jgi:hypothetical protein
VRLDTPPDLARFMPPHDPLPAVVCIRAFQSRLEAEMAQGLLESFGIESWVMSDDAGGAYPFQLSGGGAQLLVTLADQPAVQKLLSA